MKLNRLLFLAGAALLPNLLLASPVSGTLGISGSATIATTSIGFDCLGVPPVPTPCPDGSSNAVITGSSNGSFAPYIGNFGAVKSLNFFAEPINQPFLLSNFLKFNLVDIALDLTFINEGDYNPSGCSATPPAAGQQCTPIIPQLVAPTNPNGLSPLDFLNLSANNSSVSFSVKGTARRISTGETSAVTGGFTETFISPSNTTDGSFQTTLTAFNTAGNFTADYTATFIATPATVPTPEPASMALVGIGLSGLALMTRRRNARP